MDDIFPADGHPVQLQLDSALRDLDVDIAYWMERDIRQPQRFEPALAGPLFEMVKENHPEVEGASEQVKSDLAETIMRIALADRIKAGADSSRVTIRLGAEEIPLMEKLRATARSGYIFGLVAQADHHLGEGDQKAAMSGYRRALNECFRPELQLELGCLCLCRAAAGERVSGQLEPFVASELDFDEGLRAELIYHDLVEGPRAQDSETRSSLADLALHAYGRAYAHFTSAPCVEEALADRRLDDLFFRHCLALDGLRAAFQRRDEPGRALLACDAFQLWRNLLTQRGAETYSFFDERFAFVRGLERGRELERQVQISIEEVRRTVVVSDPDTFQDALVGKVAALLKDQPAGAAERNEAEGRVRSRLGERFSEVPLAIREWLVEAESTAPQAPGPLTRLALVGLYYKIAEGLLRDRLSAGRLRLGEIRDRLKDGSLRLGKARSHDALVDALTEVNDIRNLRLHADLGDPDPPSQTELDRMRDLVMREGGIIAQIVVS